MTRRYDAVLFDLLTGLLDSWTLWNAVAGDEEAGRRWRAEYLAITYRTGRYQPYEDVVANAAETVGLPRRLADELAARYGDIEPWLEAGDVPASCMPPACRSAWSPTALRHSAAWQRAASRFRSA